MIDEPLDTNGCLQGVQLFEKILKRVGGGLICCFNMY